MLRPYQEEALVKTKDALERGEHPLIILPTGTGKTVVFSHLIKDIPKNFLTLAHTRELIYQAQDKIKRYGKVDSKIEMSEHRHLRASRSTIASVQTITRRLEKYSGVFNYIITDEAHRSIAKSYQNVYEHWDDAQRIGFTATPDRADNRSLSNVYNIIAYQYPLSQAIKDKWLVPIKAKRVTEFAIDISELKVKRGDIDETELGRILIEYAHPIANSIIDEMGNRKSLIFMPNIDSSEILCEVLQNLGVKAAYLSGKMSIEERNRVLFLFRTGEIQYLLSCQILLEGYDEPSITGIVMLRPTQSRGLYAQAIGRGTRLHDGKEDMLLLEFTYNYKTLKLVKPYELFTASGYEERVQNHAEDIGGEAVDLLESLDEAHTAYYSVDRILDSLVSTNDRFNFVEFDPLAIADYCRVDYYDEVPVYYEGRELTGPATVRQVELLSRYNISEAHRLTKSQASKLISGIRAKGFLPLNGPATPRQLASLEKKGLPTIGVSKAQASILLQLEKERRKRA